MNNYLGFFLASCIFSAIWVAIAVIKARNRERPNPDGPHIYAPGVYRNYIVHHGQPGINERVRIWRVIDGHPHLELSEFTHEPQRTAQAYFAERMADADRMQEANEEDDSLRTLSVRRRFRDGGLVPAPAREYAAPVYENPAYTNPVFNKPVDTEKQVEYMRVGAGMSAIPVTTTRRMHFRGDK